MAPGCHVDKAPGRLCGAPEGRDRTPECVSAMAALASQGELSDAAEWASPEPAVEAVCSLEGVAREGPAQVASLMAGAPKPLPSPTAFPVGRRDGKEQVREAMGLRPCSLFP